MRSIRPVVRSMVEMSTKFPVVVAPFRSRPVSSTSLCWMLNDSMFAPAFTRISSCATGVDCPSPNRPVERLRELLAAVSTGSVAPASKVSVVKAPAPNVRVLTSVKSTAKFSVSATTPVTSNPAVSVMVRVSVEESATGSVPAGTAIVSKELPPPPPVVTEHVPSALSVSVVLLTLMMLPKHEGEASSSWTLLKAGGTMPLSSAQAFGTINRNRLSQIGDVEERTGSARSDRTKLLDPIPIVECEDGANVGEKSHGCCRISPVIAPADLRGFHGDNDLLRSKPIRPVPTHIRGGEANRRGCDGNLVERDRRELTDGLGHRSRQQISDRLVERPLNRFDLLEERTPRLEELGERLLRLLLFNVRGFRRVNHFCVLCLELLASRLDDGDLRRPVIVDLL